jgi:EF hand
VSSWCARVLGQVFADIDINGDGSLSYDEFRACLGKLSLDPTLTEDDVTKLLGAIDSNAYAGVQRLFGPQVSVCLSCRSFLDAGPAPLTTWSSWTVSGLRIWVDRLVYGVT